HRHARPVPARAPVVERSRDQLLASPGLPEDEYAAIGRGDLLNLPKHREEWRTRPDEFLEGMLPTNLLLQVDVLRLEPVREPLDFSQRHAQFRIRTQAFQLGAGAGGEDLQERQAARGCRHRGVVATRWSSYRRAS